MIDQEGTLKRIEQGAEVFYDTGSGFDGVIYPIGSALTPVDNITDLLAILSVRPSKRVRLLSDITLTGAITNLSLIGDIGRAVALGGVVVTDCYFELCAITGNLGAASVINAQLCLIGATTVQEGRFFHCEIDGVHIFTNAASLMYNCFFRGATLDCTNDPTLYVYAGSGDITVTNLTAGGAVTLFMNSGQVTLAASCTAGTVTIYGDCRLVDNSGGSTIVDHRPQAGAVHSMDFWSVPQEEVSIPAGAADQSLPDVTVVGLPAGATILRVVAMLKFRVVENTNVAANALAGAQEIQVRDDSPGAWADCINLLDNMFTLAASTREGGDVMIGAIDVSGTVVGNDTYNFQWDEAVADVAALNFNDVQTGLRVYFTIG